MKQRKSKIKKKFNIQFWTFFTMLVLLISFTSCDKDNDDIVEGDTEITYPTLKIVNQHGAKFHNITSVSLVGYEFNSLAIKWSQSQSFTLDKGMSAGYKDINIQINYGEGVQRSRINGIANFTNGKTTVITLNGGSGGEGAESLHLDVTQE